MEEKEPKEGFNMDLFIGIMIGGCMSMFFQILFTYFK
jgi:hypothetical protein